MTTALDATIKAGKLVTSVSGNTAGTADVTINFSDGSKLTIPKYPTVTPPTAGSTITKVETDTPKAGQTTVTLSDGSKVVVPQDQTITVNQTANALVITINGASYSIPTATGTLASFEILAKTSSVLRMANGSYVYADIRVTPSNSLVTKGDFVIASATNTYASPVTVSALFAVDSIQSKAAGIYRVYIKAANNTSAATDISAWQLVYSKAVSGADPIIVTAATDGVVFAGGATASISSWSTSGGGNDNINRYTYTKPIGAPWVAAPVQSGTAVALPVVSNNPWTSASTLADATTGTATTVLYPYNNLKSVTYSLHADSTAYGTVVPDTKDITKFVFTPKVDAFTAANFAAGVTVGIFAIYEDWKGTKLTYTDGTKVRVGAVNVIPPFASDKAIPLADAAPMVIPSPTVAATPLAAVTISDAEWSQLGIAKDYFKGVTPVATWSGSSGLVAGNITYTVGTTSFVFTVPVTAAVGTHTLTLTFTDARVGIASPKAVKFTKKYTFTAPGFAVKLPATVTDNMTANGGTYKVYTNVALDGTTGVVENTNQITINGAYINALIDNPVNASGKVVSTVPTSTQGVFEEYTVLSTGTAADATTWSPNTSFLFTGKLRYPVGNYKLLGETVSPIIRIVLATASSGGTTGASIPVALANQAGTVVVPAGTGFPISIVANKVSRITATNVTVKWSDFINPATKDINLANQVVVKFLNPATTDIAAGLLNGSYSTAPIASVKYEILLGGTSNSIKLEDATTNCHLVTTNLAPGTVISTTEVYTVRLTITDVWGNKTTKDITLTFTAN